MTYESIRFENIGPIAAGEVRRHPINVFIGPTGSGKSIAARMIHGVCRLAASRSPCQPDPSTDECAADERIEACAGHSIINSAGISIANVVTHKALSSSIEIAADTRLPKKIDYAKLRASPAPDNPPRPFPPAPSGKKNPSMYVPAGRTGIVQSYASAVRVRDALLRGAPDGDPARPDLGDAGGASARKGPHSAPPMGGDLILPEHLEAFYGTVFRSLAAHPTAIGAPIFSRIFDGSVSGSAASGIPTTAYASRDGFKDEIASASSGIVSSFPVIECIESVEKGGLLIVEEPEAHLELMR